METNPDAVFAYTDKVLFWGDATESKKVCKQPDSAEVGFDEFNDACNEYESSTILKAFLDEALASALVEGKPHLLLRKRNGVYYIVVERSQNTNPIFERLRGILGYQGKLGYITGSVKELADTNWSEAVSVKLEFRDGRPWLMIRPDVWITPMKNREGQLISFIKGKYVVTTIKPMT